MADLTSHRRAVQERQRRERARAGTPRNHGPLGIAVPETDALDVPLWTGPVERRKPETYQRQDSPGIVRCPTCTHWRSDARGACGTCGGWQC